MGARRSGPDAGKVLLRTPDGAQVLHGGAPVSLLFDMNALCALEERLEDAGRGVSVFEWLEGFMQEGIGLRARDLRLLVWAGLQELQPPPDDREAGRLLQQAGGLAALQDVILSALKASMPEAVEGDAIEGAEDAPGN
jgi:hypothetical protein